MSHKRVVIEVSRGLMNIPRIDERVALAIADEQTVIDAAAAAIDAEPRVAANTAAVARVDPGTTGATGQVISMTSSGPAWSRLPTLFIDEPRFGGNGDGVTDNHAAITAANSYASSMGGGTIDFGEGTYVVSAMTQPANNTRWRGIPGKTVIKVKDGSNAFNVFQVHANLVQFEGITFDLNKANTVAPPNDSLGIAVYFVNTSGGARGHSIHNCEVKNGHFSGVRALGAYTPDALNLVSNKVSMTDSYIHDCDQMGAWFGECTDMQITGNRFANNGADGLRIARARDSVISGNTVWGNGEHGVTIVYSRRWSMTSNIVYGNATWGIAIGGGSTTAAPNSHYSVVGNIVRGNGTNTSDPGNYFGGITVDPTITGSAAPVDQHASLIGNVCTNHSNGSGINLVHAGFMSVTGNICSSNHIYGIFVLGRYITISDNVLSTNTSQGLFLTSGGHPGHGHYRIGTNIYYGNSADKYIDPTLTDVMEVSLVSLV